jgi:hypothetical protein
MTRLRDRPLLLAALLLPTAVAAQEAAAPPDDCTGFPGASATMACFAALDIDGNGALSALEAAALPRLQGRFDELDTDADGALGPSEFQGELHTPSQLGGGKGV